MLYFFTFCTYIERHTKEDLVYALSLLTNSIHKFNKKYKIICYTNFKIKHPILQNKSIEYRAYYDNGMKLYKNKWLNLSFNKINVYKDLHDEFNIDFIWVDLDTVVLHDLSYLNDFDHFFIENGGFCVDTKPIFDNDRTMTIAFNRYIQGNFWKISIDLYHKLMHVLKSIIQRKLVLQFDLQCLFSYYIYHLQNKANVLGYNVKTDCNYGLSVWSKAGNTHANLDGLKNMYCDVNGVMKTKLYPEISIHVLGFTFFTLNQLKNKNVFKQLFKPVIS